MDKDLLVRVLADNVQLIEMLTMTSVDDMESDVDTFSYMRGAMSAYLIIKESIENGDLDLEPEQQLLFG